MRTLFSKTTRFSKASPSAPVTRRVAALLHRWRGTARTWLDWPASVTGLPRGFVFLLSLCTILLAFVMLVGGHGWVAQRRLTNTTEQLRVEIELFRLRKRDLLAEIRALEEDPRYIAHLARTHLGLVKPDLRILQLPPHWRP